MFRYGSSFFIFRSPFAFRQGVVHLMAENLKVYDTMGGKRVKFGHEGKDYDLAIDEAAEMLKALGLFMLFIFLLAIICDER